MQIFITDEDLMVSAMQLDDLRLNKQLLEVCQIITANINNRYCNDKSIIIGHINHPTTKHYDCSEGIEYLIRYGNHLGTEYNHRFKKHHQCIFTLKGLEKYMEYFDFAFPDNQEFKPAYIKGQKNKNQIISTENIYEMYRNLLKEKWSTETPKWSNRNKPNWIE